MRKVTSRHAMDCSVEVFWKVFFDPKFNEELHMKELGFTRFEILDASQTNRRVRGMPKVNMPKPVMALIGDGFVYEEEGQFDEKKSEFRWKMIPNTLRDKIRNEGTVRVEAAGEGKCTRIDDMTIEAKVFGLGGVIESSTEKEVTSAWDKTCAFMNRWVREQR
jgi:hypothetical protein